MTAAQTTSQISVSDQALKTGRHARFVYVYLPDLALSRVARVHRLDADAPLALYGHHKGTDKIRYCNAAAQSFGLSADMSLSDARALSALCRFYPVDEVADRQWLTRMAHWCWRYSPVVGNDPDRFGIWIDATGADHLWGGPQAMMADMAQRFADHGLRVHIVMASYYGAALGIAISDLPKTPLLIAETDKAHKEALASLPLYALRLTSQQIADLQQIGMSCISDLSQLKRGMLAMRFGEEVMLRRDQMFGLVPERPVPLTCLQPVMIQQHYHEPIGGLSSVTMMVRELLEGLAAMLTQMMLGCRQIEIGWQTTEGQTAHISHKLSRPSRDIRLFHRLFQDAASTIDAGFGIDYSWIKAGSLSAKMPEALIFNDDGDITDDDHDQLSQLVDHLVARLGSDRVQTLTMRENWIPEESECFVNAQSHQQITTQITDTLYDQTPLTGGHRSPRPMRLLSPPEPVQAIALLPDHPPSQLRWRGQIWRVRRATGPERIGPRWWQAHLRDDMTSRDYYRLETVSGHRLWVYRSGLPERGEAISWYMHGLFA
ncbi:MAG: hypothetical protein ACON49_04280 [Candidatus Puniceispirillaceae bacterium]